MSSTRIAITIDDGLLRRLDRQVRERMFSNRSQAIQEALSDKLDRVERSRLARECAKLNPTFETQLAEEGIADEFERWPEY
jgi:metal-responsive CopG/Arc/MetJ family transcriptional regulator